MATLTNQPISGTYQYILQRGRTAGDEILQDGLGTPVPVLYTTASWANNITASGVLGPHGANSVVSASHAITASYVDGLVATASYVDVTGSGIIVNYNGSQIQLTASQAQDNYFDLIELGKNTNVNPSSSGNWRLITSASNLNFEYWDGTKWIVDSYFDGTPYSGSGGITVQNAVSSSYALTASYVEGISFTVSGGKTIFSGSNVLEGNNNISGSNIIQGSTLISGSTQIIGGVQVVGGITGSLLGTASYSDIALTSSYTLTASYVNLVAGPNITINQNGTAFEISSSATINVDTSSLVTLSSFNSFTASYLIDSASFSASIASLNPANISGLATTASLNTFTASINNWTSSAYTGSVDGFVTTSSFNTYTGSAALATTSSINNATASLLVTASAVGNIITFTKGDASTFSISVVGGGSGSIGGDGLKVNGNNLELLSGSSVLSSVQIYPASSSVTADTASYVTWNNVVNKPTLLSGSAQIATNISGAFTTTSASFSVRVTTLENKVSTLDTSSFVTTSSFNLFTGSYNTGSFKGTLDGVSATASYVQLVAGPGITINGLEITSSIRSVNGSFPDILGNIATSLTQTATGPSSSLSLSGSAPISASLPDGLVWIISTDTNPALNGDSYIWVSSSQQWFPLANTDQSSNDARYLMLTPQQPLSGSLNVGGFNINSLGNGILSSDAINLGQLTASINPINNWTSSAYTGSVDGFVTTSSFNSFTASYLIDSASFSASIAAIVPVDISGLATTASLNTFTASINNWTSSAYTGSVDGFVTTSSFNTYTGSASSTFNGTSSYATTALTSNTSVTASYVSGAVLNYPDPDSSTSTVLRMVSMTSASYAALTPKDPNTYYIVI